VYNDGVRCVNFTNSVNWWAKNDYI